MHVKLHHASSDGPIFPNLVRKQPLLHAILKLAVNPMPQLASSRCASTLDMQLLVDTTSKSAVTSSQGTNRSFHLRPRRPHQRPRLCSGTSPLAISQPLRAISRNASSPTLRRRQQTCAEDAVAHHQRRAQPPSLPRPSSWSRRDPEEHPQCYIGLTSRPWP